MGVSQLPLFSMSCVHACLYNVYDMSSIGLILNGSFVYFLIFFGAAVIYDRGQSVSRFYVQVLIFMYARITIL